MTTTILIFRAWVPRYCNDDVEGHPTSTAPARDRGVYYRVCPWASGRSFGNHPCEVQETTAEEEEDHPEAQTLGRAFREALYRI